MKISILTLLIICLAFFTSNGQSEKIEIVPNGNSFGYQQDGKVLTINDIAYIVGSNSDAANYISSAKGNKTMASVLSFGGGFLIGWPLGTAIGGGDPNWLLAGIGGGLVLLAIPLATGANKKVKKGVDLYNASLESTSYLEFMPEIQLSNTSSGIGLVMSF